MADFAVTNLTWVDHDITPNDGLGTALQTGVATITPTGPLEEMVIYLTNTFAGAVIPRVEAGSGPSAGMGDLVLTTLANSTGTGILPPLESARFLQADGTLKITFPANAAGWIVCMQKPAVSAGSILVAGT